MTTEWDRERPKDEAEVTRLIKLLEARGALDPDCTECLRRMYPYISWLNGYPQLPFYPNHSAVSTCASGRRAHCTCDSCF